LISTICGLFPFRLMLFLVFFFSWFKLTFQRILMQSYCTKLGEFKDVQRNSCTKELVFKGEFRKNGPVKCELGRFGIGIEK